MKEKLDLSYFLRYLQTMLSDVTLYCTLFGECKLVNIDSDNNIEVKFADNKSWVFNCYGECLYGGGECVLFRTSEKIDWKVFMRQEMNSYLNSTVPPVIIDIKTGKPYKVLSYGEPIRLKSLESESVQIHADDLNDFVPSSLPLSYYEKSHTVDVCASSTKNDDIDSNKDFEINKTKAIIEAILTGAKWIHQSNASLTQGDVINEVNLLCNKYNLKTEELCVR